jgi:hypothetical protein
MRPVIKKPRSNFIFQWLEKPVAMKNLLPACLLACALSGAVEASTIWLEDFGSYTNVGITGQGATNYPSGTTNWSIDVSACATLTPGSGSAGDYFMAVSTSGGRMEAVNVDGEAVWSSAVIDISSYTNVSLSVATSETGSSANTNKYVKLFYRLDGGAETAFAVNAASIGNWTNATATQSNLYGSTVQIIARVNNPVADKSIFDAVTVSGDSTAANFPPVLDPIGDRSVMELGDISFPVTADDPIDHDEITFSATNLPTGASFSTNGVFSWSNAVPVGAYAVTFYATDKDGSTNETITITVTERPKLLISEIADPSGTGGSDFRFVELYNASNTLIWLDGGLWFLCKQANGEDSWTDTPLVGSIPAGETFVIAYSSSKFQEAYGFLPDETSSNISGTGNDAYFLYYGGNHTNGTLIDIYGEPDTDGTGTAWEYTDSRALRNNDILQPNDVWTESEWTITPNVATSNMTPGAHGPAPEFQGLENQFVFLGDSLSLIVTAVNTVLTNDLITLSATALPAGATFSAMTGTNAVSSTLNWNSPTAGVYTATLATAGAAGTATTSLVITVSSTSKIDGDFYGWKNDTIVKLKNGQFWKNTGGSGSTYSRLSNPGVTVSNQFGERRMFIDQVTGYKSVAQISITESSVTNNFSGLYPGNLYPLADGTIWKQTSSENIPSNTSATAWRWIENGQQKMRFLGRNNVVIGTCIVEASTPPIDTTIYSEIDGWFRGWQSKRVFILKNGEFWQQTSLDSSTEARYSPAVTITNWLQSGNWRMSVEGRSGYISVQQLTNVTRTAIDRWFYGFGRGNIFPLADGSWWKQTSSEISTSTRFNPEVLLWSENETDYLEMPDEGRTVSATELAVDFESTVTNTFTGLHHGNLYRLDGAGDWIQLSFENISTNVSNPSVMLWTEGTITNMIVRDSRNATIGTCVVVDPILDSDSDGFSNADEVLAGFDPLDEQSRFELRQTDRYILSWDAAEGRVYTIEWAPSLIESFQTLENNIIWPQNSWTDTVHEVSTEGFYRISVRLAE